MSKETSGATNGAPNKNETYSSDTTTYTIGCMFTGLELEKELERGGRLSFSEGVTFPLLEHDDPNIVVIPLEEKEKYDGRDEVG